MKNCKQALPLVTKATPSPLVLPPTLAFALIQLVLSWSYLAQSASAQPAAIPAPCSRASSILSKVEALRGLKALQPLDCVAANTHEFSELYRKHILSLGSSDSLPFERALFRGLAIIPENYPYERCVTNADAQGIEAFYDAQNKRIMLREETSPPDSIIAHEVMHALLDQHFDLKSLVRRNATSLDSSLAVAALIEGDALWVRSLFRDPAQGAPPKSESQKVKDICASSAALDSINFFPYTFGKIWVARLREAGGQTALDRAFLNPPHTTREIIHRDASSAERSPALDPPRLPSMFGSAKLSHVDSLGQYAIRVALGSFLSHEQAILAAKGWRADRVAWYSFEGRKTQVIVWRTLWATEQDVSQFLAGIKKLNNARAQGSIDSSARSWLSTINIGTSTGSRVLVSTEGREVLVALEVSP